MAQDVVISMHSEHGYDMKEPDRIDFFTDGIYQTEKDGDCLTYAESEITGLPGTTTRICMMPDKVVIDRSGSMTSHMVFQEGGRSTFLFETPFGSTKMGIRTNSIRREFSKEKGKLEIDYVLDFDHAAATKNRFTIEVRNA